MKKLISSLTAFIMVATSVSAISVLAADKPIDILQIKTQTLTNSVTADNGMTVPAGSVAVTVNIKNNAGFNSSANKLIIGNAYSFIADSEISPAITAGEVMGDSIVCAVENNSEIVVTSASAEYNYSDGEMFTFYLEKNNSSNDTSISFAEISDVAISSASAVSTYSTNDTYLNFFYGDVNAPFTGTFLIDVRDASFVLGTIADYEKETGDKFLPVNLANSNLDKYFPYAVCAQTADVDKSGKISEADAKDIMLFYSCASTSSPEELFDKYHKESELGHCGELGFVKASSITR